MTGHLPEAVVTLGAVEEVTLGAGVVEIKELTWEAVIT